MREEGVAQERLLRAQHQTCGLPLVGRERAGREGVAHQQQRLPRAHARAVAGVTAQDEEESEKGGSDPSQTANTTTALSPSRVLYTQAPTQGQTVHDHQRPFGVSSYVPASVLLSPATQAAYPQSASSSGGTQGSEQGRDSHILFPFSTSRSVCHSLCVCVSLRPLQRASLCTTNRAPLA